MLRQVAILLVLASLTGCIGDMRDNPDPIRVHDNTRELTGPATFSIIAADGTVIHTRNMTLGTENRTTNLTLDLKSEARYTAQLQIGDRTLTSEPFHTGLGDWWVDITLHDNEVRVSTLHGD